MRFYNNSHRFYCGIEMHARTIPLCLLDAKCERRDAKLPGATSARRALNRSDDAKTD